MTQTRQLKLGFVLHGNGVGWGDWRHPDATPAASTNFEYYKRQAQLAEKGKFDFLFVADSVFITPQSSPHYLNRFEPLTVLSGLAAVTQHIGLVGTLTVSYTEPYNVARQFSSLDHISGGRAGWNVVTSWLEGSAANYGKHEHPAHELRYKIAAEHLGVVQGLWDSWEDDALTHDKESGEFFNPSRLHALDHKGPHFSVKGPLNIARSPQGQPVIFQAGASDSGKNFAAKQADAIFVGVENLEHAKSYYADLKVRVAKLGRNPDDVLVFPGIRPLIAASEKEVENKLTEFRNLVSIGDALRMLGRPFNDHDFSIYDLDAPFPDVLHLGLNSNQSAVLRITEAARSENLTLRETALRFATPRNAFVGTPEKVADTLQNWLDERGADGFNVFESLPGQLDIFVRDVVPILQERGILRRDYDGHTLRDNLGLPFAENRYTAARGTAAA